MNDDQSARQAYTDWRQTQAGTRVYLWVQDAARQLKRAGHSHYSMSGLIAAARYDYALDVGPDVAGYKINNNHGAYLARELMARNDDLAGMFRTRATKS